ncbi:MAG: ABC transporter ATP-binding protein/permease [Roseburia sp.]|nr:ABC transporter ATP-binding protein/permease [Roseburia sp.]
MLETLKKIHIRIKEGMLKDMLLQTKWIYQYARRYWLAMIFYTALGLFGTVVGLGSSLVSRDLVDIITGHQTGRLLQTFCAMVGLAVGNIIISQITNYASNWISLKVDAEIKSDIFSKMLVTDWESIANYHTGDLLTRWSSDASNISNGILSWIPNLIINVFKFISAFAVVCYNDITFAIFSFIGIPVSLLMSKTLMNRMVSNNQRSAAMNAKMSGFNQESFSNIQTIKAFDAISYYIKRLKNLQKDYISMRLDFQRMSMVTSVIMSLVGLLVSYSSYGWGIYRVWTGAISYGTMTLFLSLSGTLTGALNSLISMVPSAINLTTSAGRLMDILEMPQEDYSLDDAYSEFQKTYQSNGISLELSDISYSYQNSTTVFEHASLEAHPHEIIALVGPSGEGKTTMLRLILALLCPQSGNGTVSSEDSDGIHKLPLTASARKLFSYVPQGNTMTSGTIAENLRMVKPEATDDEIISALKAACAWDFVKLLPDGIYSEVRERGGGFSEGQAQRLSIARALLRHSPILLLDEATSALDVATERAVLKNIMKDDYPRTCIVTTHRPTVLGMCKRVYAIREKQCVILSAEEIEQLVRDF